MHRTKIDKQYFRHFMAKDSHFASTPEDDAILSSDLIILVVSLPWRKLSNYPKKERFPLEWLYSDEMLTVLYNSSAGCRIKSGNYLSGSIYETLCYM